MNELDALKTKHKKGTSILMFTPLMAHRYL